MKLVKKTLLIVVVLVLLVLIVSLFLPSKIGMERSITINASPATIYEELIDLNKAQKWSPWSKIDPEGTTYKFTGVAFGVGQKMTWASEHPDVGTGSEEIVEAIANKKIRTELYFGGMDGVSYSDMIISKKEESSKVTWTYEGDVGSNPISKVFGAFIDQILGKSYEEGLANLKIRVESKPTFSIPISVEMAEVINYLAIKEEFNLSNTESIGSRMGEIYGQLMTYIATNEIMILGKPMSVSHSVTKEKWSVDVAVPVAEVATPESDQIIAGQTAGGKVVKGIHLGDYSKLDNTHKQLMAYITFNELEINGKGYEVYISDPREEADTTKWQTDIYYPIK